jgi:subtilisin-like proprotein convertase family protein
MNKRNMFLAIVSFVFLGSTLALGQGAAPWEYWRDTQVPINDLATASSTIDVQDAFTIQSMQVMVDIEHAAAGQLLIRLIGPTGTYVLSQYNGGAYENYHNVIFDPLVTPFPCAGAPLPTAAIPGLPISDPSNLTAYYNGVYVPSPGPAFSTGGSAIGQWTLQVFDNAAGKTGVLRKWGLIFNRYGKYKDVRWGWDINQLEECGLVTESRYPVPYVNDLTVYGPGGFPYRTLGYRPIANSISGSALLQNSKTQSATALELTTVNQLGTSFTYPTVQFTLDPGQYTVGYSEQIPSTVGTIRHTVNVYQRSDLFMTRDDNTTTIQTPVTAGSLAYDNGVALGSFEAPPQDCEASVYAIAAPQVLTSVDVWQTSSVELEPALSPARVSVRVYNAGSGTPAAIVTATLPKALPVQGNKWVTYTISPPMTLPAGTYAFAFCCDVAPINGGTGIGMDQEGSPFDKEGFTSRFANFGTEFYSLDNGVTWAPETFRAFSTKMIRPNFILGSDVGVISIDQPPKNLPASFAPVVTFGSFAHHPALPNLVTFGKIYLINNGTGQVVRYSERRVYLQNAPYTASITFDNISGLPNGSYTIRAEIERADDENLVNNVYSRQYSIPFAPIVVLSNGPVAPSLKSQIEANFADMERGVSFVDRTQAGWSFPTSGDVLWLGAIGASDAAQIRGFVEQGNTFYNLADNAATPTAVFSALSAPQELSTYAKTLLAARTWTTPDLSLPPDFAARLANDPRGILTGSANRVSLQADMLLLQNRVNAVASLGRHGLGNRPVPFAAPAQIAVEGLRLGSLPVVQVLAKNAPAARQIVAAITNPAGFELTQNYPNPFNPTTSIAYNLPKDASVALQVFDMLGRHVATLASGRQAAGRYTVAWDGLTDARESVASGIYLYRLEASPADGSAPFVTMKKMVLAR